MSVCSLGVKHYGGSDHRFEVNLDTTTVRDLKVLLAPETNLPVDDQILVYNARTLSDSQTLKDAGIFGNRYKIILGSKSYDPTGRPEDCPPLPIHQRYSNLMRIHMTYSLADVLTEEDTKKLTAFMIEDLITLAKAVSVDHLEHVSAQAWKEHQEVLKEKRDNYYKCFLDNYWEEVENNSEKAEKKAKKIQELLAAEAAAEAAEQ